MTGENLRQRRDEWEEEIVVSCKGIWEYVHVQITYLLAGYRLGNNTLITHVLVVPDKALLYNQWRTECIVAELVLWRKQISYTSRTSQLDAVRFVHLGCQWDAFTYHPPVLHIMHPPLHRFLWTEIIHWMSSGLLSKQLVLLTWSLL